MTKSTFTMSKKVAILLFITSFFIYNASYSQCNNLPPGGSSSQSFCKMDNETIASLNATGGTIVWFDAPTGGNQYLSTAPLFDGTTYYADDIDGGDCSTMRLVVTVTLDGNPPTNVTVFVGYCSTANATIGDLSATGSNIEWYDAQTGGNLLLASASLVNGETYWVQQTENGCVSSRRPTLVTIIDPPAPVTVSTQSFCADTNPTIADLTPSGSDITWYDDEFSTIALNDAIALIDGEDYWATQSMFPCESIARVQTTVAIDIPPNAGTDGNYTECELNVVTTDLYTLLGGTPDITGIWTGPSTLTGSYLGTFDPATNTPGTYTYTVSSALGICADTSANVTVEITIVPPPTTAASTQTFCETSGSMVSDLSITETNTIIWYDTETDTTPLNSSDLLADGDYWGALIDDTSGCESDSRVVITVIIDLAPDAGTDGSYTTCEIDVVTTDLFTFLGGTPETTGTWTGPSTLIGDHLGTFDPSVNTPGTYTYTVSSVSGVCADATANVTVLITVIPPPTTTLSTQIFCETSGSTVADLSVSETNTIVWYDTETDTTPLNPSDLLADGDYWGALIDGTSGCESDSRVVINVVIDLAPDAGTDGSYTTCEIDLVSTDLFSLLSGTPETTGTWTGPSTLTGDHLGTFDPSVNIEGTYTYTVSSLSGACADAIANVTVLITEIPPPTTSQTTQTFCETSGSMVSDLSVTETNTITWYDTETDTTPLNPSDLLSDGDYWGALIDGTSGCESDSRVVVTVVIDLAPDAGTDGSYTVCEIDLVTTDLYSLLGGTPETTGTWTGPSTLTGDHFGTFDPSVNIEGTYTYTVSSLSGACADATANVNVLITEIPPPTTTQTTQTYCETSNSTVADLSVSEPNTIMWYDTETDTVALNPTDLLADGDYWGALIDGTSGCESASRIVVNVVIEILPNAGSDVNFTICEVDLISTDLFSLLEGSPDTTGAWTGPSTLTGGHLGTFDPNTSLSGTYTYTVSNTTNIVCPPSTVTADVIITIIQIMPPSISNGSQTFCASDGNTVADIAVSSTTLVWYDSETSTSPLNSSDLLTNADYWAAESDATSGCESIVRMVVTVTLTDPGTPTLSSLGNEFCKINNPTVSDLDNNVSATNGGMISWYDSYPNGSILSSSEALIEGQTYYAVQDDTSGCLSATPLAVTVTLEACDDYSVEIYDGFSPSGDGINETFTIKYLRDLYPNFKVEFFNRWGATVYTSNASKPDWDGRLNGTEELVPAGVYYVIVYYNDGNKKPEQKRLYLSR